MLINLYLKELRLCACYIDCVRVSCVRLIERICWGGERDKEEIYRFLCWSLLTGREPLDKIIGWKIETIDNKIINKENSTCT